MLKQTDGLPYFNRRGNPQIAIQRKEVTKMADKKNNCGCGCIPLKEVQPKAPKGKKKVKKAK
jgi:hypothetical protein